MGKLVKVTTMCCRIVARQSGRKGGRSLVPMGVRIEVGAVSAEVHCKVVGEILGVVGGGSMFECKAVPSG
jgi:hypothetical protein